jgi:hypothetical protein
MNKIIALVNPLPLELCEVMVHQEQSIYLLPKPAVRLADTGSKRPRKQL